jgi:hypothetical protein
MYPDEEAAPADPPETWILQGEAAARTGFSVSAIRKWRRMGLVAERKISMGADLPRVEVKLEDVLARVAMQPQRRPLGAAADASAQAPPGCLVIGISDLEELFERMVRAERRAEQAEADLQAMEVQTRYTLGRLAELRRQLGAQASEPAGEAAPVVEKDDDLPSPPSWVMPGTRARTGPDTSAGASGPGGSAGASALRRAPSPVIRVSGRPVATATAAAAAGPVPAPLVARVPPAAPVPPGPATELELLAGRLRTIYARLDGYRSLPSVSPAMDAQRQRELADYDQALLAVCTALDIPTGVEPGAAVEVDARARLTRALARAGVDVREAGGAGVRPRLRRPAPGTRA